jgi:chromosome segregation ATPase
LTTEFLSELENKIDSLIGKVQTLKQEKETLTSDCGVKDNKISDLETENVLLQEELRAVKNNYDELQKKLGVAAEKVQGLLSKLDSIE